MDVDRVPFVGPMDRGSKNVCSRATPSHGAGGAELRVFGAPSSSSAPPGLLVPEGSLRYSTTRRSQPWRVRRPGNDEALQALSARQADGGVTSCSSREPNVLPNVVRFGKPCVARPEMA